MAKLHALSASEKVLVEAVAGAIGGFAGAVAFYPVDTIKTRIQASVGDGTSGARRKTMTEVFRELVANEGYGALFAGVGAKGAHSMASSFLFFLAFSTMRAGAEKRSDKKIGVAANLAIAALAGCINVLFTEPLDTLSTQRQIRGIDDIDDDDDDDDELTSKTKSSTKTKSANCESRTRFTGDMSYVLDSLKQWKKLYRGLGASLLLTINPAIQYTVFEQSKRRVLFGLQKRSARKGKALRVSQIRHTLFLPPLVEYTTAVTFTAYWQLLRTAQTHCFISNAGDCSDRWPVTVDQAIVQYIAIHRLLGATRD